MQLDSNINFNKGRILVVGDVMLDRYWSGQTMRVSPESPTPIVNLQQFEDRLGGAANLAANIVVLSNQVCLLGIIGDDDDGQRLQELCVERRGMRAHFQYSEKQTTITKLRVLSQHQQLVRLDFEDSFAAVSKEKLFDQYQQQLKTVALH